MKLRGQRMRQTQISRIGQHTTHNSEVGESENADSHSSRTNIAPATVQGSAALLQRNSAVNRSQILRQLQTEHGNDYVRRVVSEYHQIQRAGPMSAEKTRNQAVSDFQEAVKKGNEPTASAKEKHEGERAAHALEGMEAFETGKLEDDAFYEQMACMYAYLPLQEGQILPGQANGGPTKYQVVATLDDPETGLQAFSVVPLNAKGKPWGGGRKSPIVVFRGSEKHNLKEGFNDFGEADFLSLYIGASQFAPNRAKIERLFKAAGADAEPAIVTGHSLGGALAQKATVEFFDMSQRVVTFQAPGIAAADFERFEQKNERAKKAGKKGVGATGYAHEKDIVSMAGEQHLAANDTRVIKDGAAGDAIEAHTTTYLWKEQNAGYMSEKAGSSFEDRVEDSFIGILAEPVRRFLGGLVAVTSGAVETGMNVVIGAANGAAELGASLSGTKLEEHEKFQYFNPLVIRSMFSLIGAAGSFTADLTKGLLTLNFDSIKESATELSNTYNDLGVGLFGGAKFPQTLFVEMCNRLITLAGKRTRAYLEKKISEAVQWIKETVSAMIDSIYQKLIAFKDWLVKKMIEYRNKAKAFGNWCWEKSSEFVSDVNSALISGMTRLKSWWSSDD
jgi:hypothetical protein